MNIFLEVVVKRGEGGNFDGFLGFCFVLSIRESWILKENSKKSK